MTAVVMTFGYEKCATAFEPRVCVSQIQTELLKMEWGGRGDFVLLKKKKHVPSKVRNGIDIN